jgi:hypothetical protein
LFGLFGNSRPCSPVRTSEPPLTKSWPVKPFETAHREAVHRAVADLDQGHPAAAQAIIGPARAPALLDVVLVKRDPLGGEILSRLLGTL